MSVIEYIIQNLDYSYIAIASYVASYSKVAISIRTD